MKSIKITLYLFIIALPLFSQSNEGKDFWFGFMEHRDVGENTKVVMITSKQNTQGVISIPLYNWSQSFSVTANNVQLITLPAFAETIGSEKITTTGIHITSEAPVSAYIHQYFGFRSEASIVLPTEALDKEYFVMSYKGFFQRETDYPSEFLIIATEDETEVTITPSDFTLKGKKKGGTFTVLLDQGETYQVQARAGAQDLTGSHIIADKKIAVFGGNSWTQVPEFCAARDNLLEQMYPVSTWGRQILTVPSDKVNYDVFRILASADNTQIEVQGSSITNYKLDRGEWLEYNESEATFIVADKPILVAQYLIGSSCNGHSLGDPSMFLLSGIEQTRDTVTLFNSRFQAIHENYINIITRTVDTNLIILDGQFLIDQGVKFTAVGANGNFSYARVQVKEGAHTISSDGCGVIATAYGYGDVESYAYSGGASFSSINANPIPEGGCLNDTVFFDTGLSPNRYNFLWDLGDGHYSDKAKFEHYYPNLGSYAVQLILEDECIGTVDTLNRDLIISLRQAVAAEEDIELCQGESFQLGATDIDGATYEWLGPNDFFFEEQFPTVMNAQPNMSGAYQVVGIVSGCATHPSFLSVKVNANPVPNLGEDAIICTEQFEVELEAASGYMEYDWQDGSKEEHFNVTAGGLFWVRVKDENECIGVDSVKLTQQCPTKLFIPNVFSPNGDGNNDRFQVVGDDILSLKMRIYNRWGTLMFESQNKKSSWDGTFNREERAAEGVYMYEIVYEGIRKDGSTYNGVEYGTVTLLR
jgi:gliding motility-associated-like protein